MTTPNTDIEVMKAMASLFRKKAAVMKALEGGIAKSGSNTHFNYKFMTASEIKHIVGGLFADNGLSLQMSGVATENAISKVERKEGPVKEVPILRIQFAISLCDMDTGAVEQSFWFGEAQATDDKAASKCATSALKYFLISNLMIADKEEDKRDTDRGPRRQQPAQTQQAAPVPSPLNAEPAKPAAPKWWGVLGEYKPFMEPDDFARMRDGLSDAAKKGALSINSDDEARDYIERTQGLFIDMDAKRAAAKEAS